MTPPKHNRRIVLAEGPHGRNFGKLVVDVGGADT
jgi:hypothetical protein